MDVIAIQPVMIDAECVLKIVHSMMPPTGYKDGLSSLLQQTSTFWPAVSQVTPWTCTIVQLGGAQHSTAQHSTAQHSTAHHSTAQHSPFYAKSIHV